MRAVDGDSFQEEAADERSELLEVSIIANGEVDPEEDPVQLQTKFKLLHLVVDADFWTKPWMGWSFTCALMLLFFSVYRWSALEDLIAMYGSAKDLTLGLRVKVLLFGVMEDVVCTTYFVCALWIFDLVRQAVTVRCRRPGGNQRAAIQKRRHIARISTKIATFLASWLLFVAAVVPFVADMLLVRLRQMRFSLDLVVMAINESEYISAAPIATEEFNAGYVNAGIVIIVATLFATARAQLRWTDLARWDPTNAVVDAAFQLISTAPRRPSGDKGSRRGYKYDKLTLDEGRTTTEGLKSLNTNAPVEAMLYRGVSQSAVLLMGLVVFPMFVVGVISSSSALVAYSALNATLDQLFKTFIHYQTEDHQLFDDNSLFRRTTGFHGDLAFDVAVDPVNPPNVMVLAVEGSNITVTPNFDRWAKRGVSFRNMWSSTPTSRSLESILFAQVPYDSVTTGIAGGKENTELSGMPQFFAAKGYETYFTTGCALNYDGWDVFFSSHGYDNVWGRVQMWDLAETDMGIKPDQWDGPEKRRFGWGVHDDVSFQLVGDLLLNKTRQQNERVARGERKQPTFITHYTISSHEPFYARPTWYAESEKPDFSALYEGLERANVVKNYLEMRYFTDMELGKFLDRMEAGGVLNDTIVVIVATTAGVPRFPTATLEHYDLLNTLADITGVPDRGFLQDGVGRSLKRKIPFGERVVFGNNPTRKMSVVRGHQRLQYDRVGDSVLLHNANSDHDMQVDLFPNLTTDEQTQWLAWRDIGRDVSRYYVQRWDGKCLLAVDRTDS
ncbi:hypothetical protein PHYSODRAFT_330624 [Phytophthora sojae]|uniref:Sulfatase N-terminal domain-containing protein n=1 Tax=Phytophthora sojae (strain P6497) TaxID=1094619 RepID=G4ZEN3_PHYSP|nr:hypothetical protein PHYSODRAFT_330624 [Phytophthora sojae]EGZ16556.1 hypothetical protein PHYSODRAFT_330624 [Phytophthora sojae]|eukprot:XP_009525614.1 hypothetical protein PHYSODRAFT_330624 [Phytophthora sojae]